MLKGFFIFCFFIPFAAYAEIGPKGFEGYSERVFVETGSFRGEGIQKAIEAGYKMIHSLELNPANVDACRKKYAKHPHVTVHHKDSGAQLWDVIANIDEPITFWLDAHNGAPDNDHPEIKNTPLMEELEQIKQHPIKTHTILIDDLRCCDTLYFDFISLEEIIEKLYEINPNYTIQYRNGGIKGERPNDVLVAIDLHQKVFTNIYDKKVWGTNSEGNGFSGGGSLVNNTKPYITLLQNFMREHNIGSVVDSGCGDWEFSRTINWKGIDYVGYDVVHSVIKKDIEKYSAPNILFVHANFLKEDLPPADLFICKDVFQHLSNKDVLEFIPQLKKYKYCLITNEVNPETLSSNNSDIQLGSTRKIDLSKSPFNLEGVTLLNYKIGNRTTHQVFLIRNGKY